MIHSVDRRREIYGVDFSGAAEAGTRIWVARGTVEDNRLRIEECLRGDELPGSDRGRSRCFAALRTLIETHPQAVFGFDFPFSIPATLIHRLFGDVAWEQFVLSFPERFPTPRQFREACVQAAGGRELRRDADQSLLQRVLTNPGGDALDSVVAAFAVFKNLQDPSFDIQHPLRGTESDGAESLEGFVYA